MWNNVFKTAAIFFKKPKVSPWLAIIKVGKQEEIRAPKVRNSSFSPTGIQNLQLANSMVVTHKGERRGSIPIATAAPHNLIALDLSLTPLASDTVTK